MTTPGAAPIPSDVPTSAPIFGDAERGYHDSEEEDPSAPVGATSDRRRNESDTSMCTAVEAGPAPQDDRAIRIKGHGRGLTEGDQDMEELPKNNFLVVMPAIGLVLFLAALDMSIVATALPTIAEQLHATPSEYSWVGTAYTLGMTLQTPLNGRFSDVVGRKPMLQTAILVFTVFSALCGAAKSMTWLIIARAFQGVGGGSIIGLTNIIVSEIVPLSKRPMYQGVLGATWGIASVLGPILGGILTEKVSWRWTFYINLPISGVAFVGLWFSLTLNPTKRVTLRSVLQTFDFLGMFLLMAGGSIFIVGFAIAADHGFGRPDSYALIVVGTVLLGLSVVNFLYTKRNAVIPARMFKNRTTLFFLIGSFLQALAFLPSNYLLPQMFQGVRGAGALDSGVQLLPYAVVVALSTVVAGQINSRLRIVRPVAWFGYGLGAIGFGLFYHFYRYPFSLALQEGLLVVAAIGIGLSLSVPVICIQAAMPLKETGVATTAWSLTRSLGGSVGLALFTAVLNTNLRSKFAAIEGYGVDFQVPEDASGYKALQDLPDGRQKDQVLGAFADSLGLCWIIDCAVLIVALLLTVWTRSYTLNRTGGKQQPSPTTSTELSTDEKLDPQDRTPGSDHEAADLDSDKHDHLESPLSEKIPSTNKG